MCNPLFVSFDQTQHDSKWKHAICSVKKKRSNKKKASSIARSTKNNNQSCQKLCDHGCLPAPVGGSNFDSFLENFYAKVDEWTKEPRPGGGQLTVHELVSKEPRCREALSAEHVKSFLIAQGITLILQATADKNKEKTDVAIAKMRLAITFAEALLAIGAFNKAGMKEAEAYGLKLCRAIRDFYASEDFQTLIRFFAQRAPCACLDLEVKKVDHQPKMGLCCACHQSMEFQALMKCTQCKVAHCCSRACQVANWSLHKNFCQKVSKSHCEKRNRANAILGQRTNRSSGATRRRPGNSRGRRGLLAIVFACEISRRATSKGDHVGWNASAAACQILIRHPDTIPQCCCARCHSAAWFVQ